MSDNTPTSAAGDDGERGENVEPTAEDAADASSEDLAGNGEAAESEETEPAIARKTAAAPKRRKKTVSESDDEQIAALEDTFTPEEQSGAEGIHRKTAKAPVRKQTATRTRESARGESADHDPYSTKNPVTFAKQSGGELKKVVWPTGKEMRTYFLAVLVFVLFVITYVGLLDLLFGWGLLNLLGD